MKKLNAQWFLKLIYLAASLCVINSNAIAVTYDDDIRPNIFVTNASNIGCLDCHTSGIADRSGGLPFGDATLDVDFDTYARTTARDTSDRLISDRVKVRAVDEDTMPPTDIVAPNIFPDLSTGEQTLITNWINQGAPEAAPQATTNAASVAATSVTLNSTINTKVHSATTVAGTFFYEYEEEVPGSIGAYDFSTTPVTRSSTASITASNTEVTLSSGNGGDLLCGTEYNFRAVATNGHSQEVGVNSTFVTTACTPPNITTTGNQSSTEDESTTFDVSATAGESGALTWTIESSGGSALGTYSIIGANTGSTVTIQYVPDSNAFGTDTDGVIKVTETDGVEATLPITMIIAPVADTPNITNATTDEDVLSSSGLIVTRNANDSTEVTHLRVTNISGGTLFLPNGSTEITNNDVIPIMPALVQGLKFLPAQDSTANGSFDIQAATDNIGSGLSASETATITVIPVDDAPTVANEIADVSVAEDAANTLLSVSTTFTDLDNVDSSIVKTVLSNSNESLVLATIVGDILTLDYQANQNGSATIVVQANSNGLTVTDSFEVTVSSQIDAPSITEISPFSPPATAENTNTTFDLNAVDVEAGTLTWSIQAQGVLGTFSIDASSMATSNPVTILYTPNSNVSGVDTTGVIKVTNETTGLSATVDIIMTITGVGAPPVIDEGIADGTITPPNFDEDTDTTFTLNYTASETGTLTWTVDTQGSKGVFSFDTSDTASPVTVRYSPAENENGADATGIIKVTNGSTGLSDTIAVTMNINSVNDVPTIVGASPLLVPATDEDTETTFVLSGSDIEAGTLTWSIQTQGDLGVFSIDAGSVATDIPVTIRYVPNANVSGVDTAGVIQLTNGTTGESQTLPITMTIIGQGDAPVINQGDATFFPPATNEDTETVFSLDVTPGEPGTRLWTIDSLATNKGVFSFDTAAIADSVNVRYAPSADLNGTDSATFTVTNQLTGLSDSIEVSVTITPVNDAPEITSTAPTAAMVLTEQVAVDVYQLSQTDIDDTEFTYSLGGTGLLGDTPAGDMAISATGLITWTPPRTGVFNGLTATVTVTISDADTSTLGANVLTDTQTFSVSTIPVDTDGDGVADYADNCPTIANAGQEDLDNDTVRLAVVDASGIPADGDVDPTARDAANTLGESYLNGGDACDEDIDGDGLSNDFENLAENTFLDPFNAADALADQDGDELSNLSEFLAGTNVNLDSVGPTVTPPNTITVNALGSRTTVDIGQATAVDNADPAIDVVRVALPTTNLNDANVCSNLRKLPEKPDTFRVGRNVVTWVVCDVAGNLGMATQVINVVPLVSVSSGSVSGEGQAVSVDVMLNGAAAAYPVTVTYKVSGTAASGSDHDLPAANGSVTFADPDTVQSINFNVLNDANAESDETVVVTLLNANNAVLGSSVVHTLTITDANVAPQINLAITQGGDARGPVVYQTDGVVTMTSNATDVNGDTLSHNWNSSDTALLAVATINGDTITFDPAALTAGTLFSVEVTVSDGTASTTVNRLISVKDAVAVTLEVGKDSDGDGLTDDVEGFKDSDADGIPDYLDSAGTPANVIESQTGNLSAAQVVETEPGLSISLGATAIAADATGVHISPQDVIDHGGAAGGLATNAATDYTFTDALFSFEIAGLTPAMQSVNVVLPLAASIQKDVVYRKYIETTGWADFVEDDLNRISSALGENGVCPEPGSDDYTTGLTFQHNCVQLTIQDGGANDADGLRNFVVKDPGGLALEPIDEEAVAAAEAAAEEAANSSGRAGALAPLTIWLLFVLSALVVSLRRR